MDTNQHTSQLVERTVQAFNGDVIAVSAQDGISLIDSWISALHSGDASTNPIASTLSELKLELQRGNPDANHIQDLLGQLAGQASAVAEKQDGVAKNELNELGTSLREFGQQLAGERGPANTSGRAPMTSTVGDTSIGGVAHVN